MKKIFFLSTCSTCQRIMTELGIDASWEQQDIKTTNIDAKTLDEISTQYGSYESIFSKRAMKYKSMGIKEKVTKDEDYRQLILDEYTFLKRPVIHIENEYFVGNSKKNIEAAKTKLGL